MISFERSGEKTLFSLNDDRALFKNEWTLTCSSDQTSNPESTNLVNFLHIFSKNVEFLKNYKKFQSGLELGI